MRSVLQDIRYSIRILRKSPLFVLVAALTIALGIGATTTIFSVVNATLLKPPPRMRNAGELVRVYRIAEDGSSYHSLSYPNFRDYLDEVTGLADLAATIVVPVAISDADGYALLVGICASHDFLTMLGARPAVGRFFTPEEDAIPAAQQVAVLSHGTWMSRFGGDTSIVGQIVQLHGHQFTVVGVTEEGFRGPNTMVDVGVWLPISTAPLFNASLDIESRSDARVSVFGRRAPGASVEQISVALNVKSANLRASYPDEDPGHGIEVQRYAPVSRRALGPALAFSMLLFVVSGTVLLIACLNVGSMLLARATRRNKEMAMRLALGAGRARVVRQMLTENIMLFTLGGVGGVLITLYVTELLSKFQLPIEVPIVFDFAPDLRVLVFTLATAGFTGILFGLAPALQATRGDVHETLKQEQGTGLGRRSRLRNAFVVVQVAGSALLLVAAGLFTRGLARAHSVNLGFDPDDVHAVSTELEFFGYTADRSTEFYREFAERALQLPEVEAVGLVDAPPVTLGGRESAYAVAGGEPVYEENRPTTDVARVSHGYLEVFRIPILRGRGFTDADRAGGIPVAIVNETLAQRSWPGADPIGKRIRLATLDDIELEVVGIARNAKYRTLTEDPRPMVYVPHAQWPSTSMVLLARSRRGASLAQSLRSIVLEIDNAVQIDANTPYRDLMGIAQLPSRAAALFSTVFGALGLVLASLGLYGVLAFTVAQRRREIGIRVAIGARPQQVVDQVLWDGVKLAGLGLAIGFAIALALSHLLRSLLFGLSPADPITFGAIAALLLVVAFGASYVPAIRATRTDPVEALRAE